jgi:hypothetical protein
MNMIIKQLHGFLYTLEPWIFSFYLKIKTGQWVVDPTKYWVTRKSRYDGPGNWSILSQRW